MAKRNSVESLLGSPSHYQFPVGDAEDPDPDAPAMKPKARTSLFHHPDSMIAFAPNSSLDEEIEAIYKLPAPADNRKKTDAAAERWKLHHGQRYSDEPGRKSKSYGKTGKVPLPRPYKKHGADLQMRRAERSFIYGRDEENEFSERDSRVKTPCCGVICFHALELIDLVVNKKSFVDTIPISYFCLLSIGPTKRCTKIVHAWDPHQIKMDYFVHLSVDVSEWREAPNNRLRIELWSFQDPEAHFIVGTVEIHIYNFIRLQHTIDTTFLWSDGIKVGKLAYEVAFSYGAFGYGHSNQLKNFSQPIMETISHSMFPRIKLDERADLADPTFQNRLPDKLKLFTYHSLILEVDDKNPSAFFGRPSKIRRLNRIDLEPKPIVVQQVEFEQGFPVHCKLHMNIWQKVLQPDFNDMYGEFVCIGHKRGRLDYLANMVQGKMRDLYEEEAAPLFEHLEQKDLDHINRTDNIPGEILYPKSIPCPYSEPYKIGVEDEKFQDKFPAVRREPGYLSKIFGFKEEEPKVAVIDVDAAAGHGKQVAGDDEINYLKTHRVIPSHAITHKHCSLYKWLLGWLSKMRRFGIKILLFIFPEVREPLEVPELSVTVASPEGSTTNVYSYFAREVKDLSSNSKLDRIVKQTALLMEQARKAKTLKKLRHSSSDSSSSGGTDDEHIQEEIKL